MPPQKALYWPLPYDTFHSDVTKCVRLKYLGLTGILNKLPLLKLSVLQISNIKDKFDITFPFKRSTFPEELFKGIYFLSKFAQFI